MPAWLCKTGALFLLLVATALVVEAQSFPQRYRVRQTLRLETTQSQGPGGVYAPEPMTTVVEGRLRYVLEQTGGSAALRTWRLLDVEVEPPHTSPPQASNPDVERALQLGLNWMAQSEGKDFASSVSELPVVPLGEAAPPWLTSWLQWAQMGGFSGVEADPAALAATDPVGSVRPSYQIRWVRSEFRRQPCHVQESRWVVPVTDASESLPASLAAAGVAARTLFSAQSLEWVSQSEPTLIYAERSAARETFWDMSGVEDARLRDSVFRLRLSVNVTVERLP